jgi:tetratricopeptide (TPR) repeat protein
MWALRALAVVSCLGSPSVAWALTCDEVRNMVDVNVPDAIVRKTIDGAAESAEDTEELLRCLEAGPASDHPEPERPLDAFWPDVSEPCRPFVPTESSVRRGQGGIRSSRVRRWEQPLGVCEILLVRQAGSDHLTAQEQYYFAKLIQGADDLVVAWDLFAAVARRGADGPYFKYAVPMLVAMADAVDRRAETLQLLADVPADRVPRQVRRTVSAMRARDAMDRGDVDAALAYALEFDPDRDLERAWLQAEILSSRGDFDAALAAFHAVQLPEEDPRPADESSLALGVALVHGAAGRCEEALATLNSATFTPRDRDRAALLEARCSWNLGRDGDAIRASRRVAAWSPEARLLEVRALERLGRSRARREGDALIQELDALIDGATSDDLAARIDDDDRLYGPLSRMRHLELAVERDVAARFGSPVAEFHQQELDRARARAEQVRAEVRDDVLAELAVLGDQAASLAQR